ncbi:MAG: hypothetical protein ABSF98_02140 [Bryobacteraceae bacterium]
MLLVPRILLSIAKGIIDSPFLTGLSGIIGQTLIFTAAIVVAISLARHEHNRLKSYALAAASIWSILLYCVLIDATLRQHHEALISLFLAAFSATALRWYWNRYHTTPNLKGRAQLNVFVASGIFLSAVWLFNVSKPLPGAENDSVFGLVQSAWRRSHVIVQAWLEVHSRANGFQDPQVLSLVTSIILCVSGLVAMLAARLLMKQSALQWIAKRWSYIVLAGAKYVFSLVLLSLLATYVGFRLPALVWWIRGFGEGLESQSLLFFFCIIIPAAMVLFGLSTGMAMVLLGRILSPYMRENVTDLTAAVYRSAALWAALSSLAIYGPLLFYGVLAHADAYFWVLWSAAAAGAWLRIGDRRRAPPMWGRIVKGVVTVAPYAFLLGLLVVVSFGISRWGFHIDGCATVQSYFRQCEHTLGGATVWLCAVVLFAAALFSARSGVNSSSMHRYYLARLAETFLGEAPAGAPKGFRAFSSSGMLPDRLRLHQLRPSEGYQGPVLLINCCLNSRSREDPRARLGENFIFAPQGCGYFPSDGDGTTGIFQDPARYFYSGEEGISLASSMAISGSALASGMGYLTSFRTRLSHTVFNIRLGWWFCNPRYPGAWNQSIPRSRISCFMKELLGNMTDRDPFVYLSDGGHFDNLGAYELFRRRCHVVIVSDASQDKDRMLTSLAHTVSKVRTDLGVEIEFDEDQDVYRTNTPDGRVSVGRIKYPDQQEGILIYVKPEVLGTEPVDVVGYSRRHPAFPHDPTSRQWLSESQFEAYRRLGELSGEAVAEQYWECIEVRT